MPNTEPEKYGGALVDERGAVTAFTRRGSGERSYHFIGVQVAQSTVFEPLPDHTPHESPWVVTVNQETNGERTLAA